ncbi:hypothetical protein V6Z11_A13G157400 [Gossypium hirsutum]
MIPVTTIYHSLWSDEGSLKSLHCKIFATVSSSPRLADERLY